MFLSPIPRWTQRGSPPPGLWETIISTFGLMRVITTREGGNCPFKENGLSGWGCLMGPQGFVLGLACFFSVIQGICGSQSLKVYLKLLKNHFLVLASKRAFMLPSWATLPSWSVFCLNLLRQLTKSVTLSLSSRFFYPIREAPASCTKRVMVKNNKKIQVHQDIQSGTELFYY